MPIELRDYQTRAVDMLREAIRTGARAPCLVAPTGMGKCLGFGTPVLMYDGTIKRVEDINVGDRLMGPDSQPKTVLSLARGEENMYKIIPMKGDSYICNESHILSLKGTGGRGPITLSDGTRIGEEIDIVNVNVKTFMDSNKTARHCLKGWRSSAIDFGISEVLPIPPYILGLWLGDGTATRVEICKPRSVIIDEWEKYAADNGCSVTITDQDRCPSFDIVTKRGLNNPCLDAFRSINVIKNKHIPHQYKTASINDRLELLAGLIDTDGHLTHNSYDFIQKSETLINDVVFLARSLGFSCYIKKCTKGIASTGFEGEYFRISICGDTDRIPCRLKKASPRMQKKNHLVHGITIEHLGVGKYYGFELDGDGLFLLGDFTVTHNTRTAAAIIESTVLNGKRALFIAPRRNLVEQTHREFKKLGIDSAMIMAGVHFDPCQRVEIASIDTIMARLDNKHSNGVTALQAADLILIDEGHTCASEQRAKLINDIRSGVYGPRKIVILLTATPCTTGGGGLGNISDGLVIPVTMPELIEGGHLLQPRYYSAERPDLTGVKMVGDDYNSKQLGAVYDGKIMGCVVDNWLKIAPGTSTVVFTATRANASDVVDKFNSMGVPAAYVDANTPDEERKLIFDGIESGRILVIANVMIIGMGTDIPRLQTVSFATATKSISRWMQGVGRVLRPYDGQEFSFVIDHGGMVLDPRMGPVEFINDWSLDEKTTVQERVEKRKQEKKDPVDVACPACSYTYRAAYVCPKCGHQRKKKGEALEYHDVELKQVDAGKLSAADKRNRTTPAEEKRKFYGEVLEYVMNKGGNPGRAAHIYRSYYGCWPNAHKDAPRIPPSEETLSYIKSQAIRHAKSRKTA